MKKNRRRRRRRSRRWWTDGRGLEVDGGQPAAGGLRELGQHTGQRPVLGLQPLFNLPQGLNLLYLGEVLQGGGGRDDNHDGEQREGGGMDGRRREEETEEEG